MQKIINPRHLATHHQCNNSAVLQTHRLWPNCDIAEPFAARPSTTDASSMTPDHMAMAMVALTRATPALSVESRQSSHLHVAV
jgi:hypothetical protein